MPDNELYRMIGEIQASVADLKTGQGDMIKDVKKLQDSLTACQLKSKGIAPILSGAGLGGIIGGIAGYFGKFFT